MGHEACNDTVVLVAIVAVVAAVLIAFQTLGVPIAALLLFAGAFALPDGRARSALFNLGVVLAVFSLLGMVLLAALI